MRACVGAKENGTANGLHGAPRHGVHGEGRSESERTNQPVTLAPEGTNRRATPLPGHRRAGERVYTYI